MTFTESVRSFQVPATPGTSAWPPSTPSVPTSRATPVTCSAKRRRVSVMALIVSARAATSPLASTVTFWPRSPSATAVVTAAIWRTWSVRFDAMTFTESVRSPGARDALDLGLAAEHALRAHLARDAGDLVGERRELGDHGVDRPLELEDLAASLHGDGLAQVAVGHCGRHAGDLAHLLREVRRHEVTESVRSRHVPTRP